MITISPRLTARFLIFVVLGLALASILGQFNQYFLPDYFLRDTLIRLFDLNQEGNIPTMYSALALLLCSVLLAIIAYVEKVARKPYVPYWGALSIIFLFFSLDEAIALHERAINPLNSFLDDGGFSYLSWVIPAVIFVFLCLLAFGRFLNYLPGKTRRIFLVAGTLFVASSIGMKLVGLYYLNLYGQEDVSYAMIATVEEFIEMVSIVFFIYALLSYLSSHEKEVKVSISKEDRIFSQGKAVRSDNRL
ncbi:MAG: hypothetical protein BRC38_11895 [Cyanobacteria bacterium QH_6_48_35]|nr:MAG: hypothetical protein BRC38_11895 [Cyanobacteria bacterium QH_6_48_35]